jgi:hypothetical protein
MALDMLLIGMFRYLTDADLHEPACREKPAIGLRLPFALRVWRG